MQSISNYYRDCTNEEIQLKAITKCLYTVSQAGVEMDSNSYVSDSEVHDFGIVPHVPSMELGNTII